MKIGGIVIHGDGFGRTLGFPTANIDRDEYAEHKMDIEHGVYAGTVTRENGSQYTAGIVVGPLDTEGLPKLEAHLLDFDGDLYGERLVFEVGRFLRPFQQYDSIDEIKEAIAKDIETIRNLSTAV